MASRSEKNGGRDEQSRRAGARAGWTSLVVAGLALGAVLFFARSLREGTAPPLAPPDAARAPSAQPAVALEHADEPVRVEVASEGASAPAPTEGGERAHPPTPERPGPGQALLRVEVAAVETGTPLAGVLLYLSRSEDENDEHRAWVFSTQSDPSRGVEDDRVHTDAAGRGEFVLPVGVAYELRAVGKNGLAKETDVQVAALHAGEDRSVALALRTAWEREWSGRVIDGETELPLAGADVTALVRFSADTLDGLHVLARGRSAANGRIGFRLPAWEHISVCATVPGYFRGSCRVERSERGEVPTVALVRSASLAARVLRADGTAAAGIDVRLHCEELGICYDLGLNALEWRATADADGRCDFGDLPASVGINVDLMRGEQVLLRPADVRIPLGEQRTVEWRLEAGCSLAGVVRDAGGSALAEVPLVLSQLPQPLWMLALREGDRVTFERARLPELATVAQLRSDASGRFALDEVGPGAWALGPHEDARAWPQATVVFEIETGQTTEEVELELARDLFIEGVVVDPDGKPLRDMGITCAGNDPRRARVTRSEWSDREGRFVLGPLLDGDYRLNSHPNDPMHAASYAVLARSGARDVVVRLRWGASLGGSVVDGETGVPVKATVQSDDGTIRAFGSEEFLFESLAPGLHDFVARTDDGRIGVLSVQARERTRDETLLLPVRRGAKLTLKSPAPKDDAYQVEVEWQGILMIASEWENTEVTVPPGAIVARWRKLDNKGGSEVVHEESRVVEIGQEIVLEYREP